MKNVLSHRQIFVANVVAKIPFMKAILKPFYYSYKKHLDTKRNICFLKNGLSVLKQFDNAMMQNNIPYSVFAGTLLGAIRERGFLKHDMDIDTMMFYSDYSPKVKEVLENSGFKLIHRFTIDNGKSGMEETYEKDDVTIDIYFIYSDDKFPTYQCDWKIVEGAVSWVHSMEKYGYLNVRRNEFPVSKELVRVPFETIEVNAIKNAHEWLSARYGQDYMIPNPSFHDRIDNPLMYIWQGKKAKFETF